MRFTIAALFLTFWICHPAIAQQTNTTTHRPDTADTMVTSTPVPSQTIDQDIKGTIRPNTTVFKSVGYGKIPSDQVLGAVSTLENDAYQKNTYSNMAEYLRGRVPGVTVHGTRGSYSVIIRGVGTFNSSTQPLFILDGTPVSPNIALESVNPADVKSVSVIKDGTAAIYGSRGANGVIIIETQ